MTTPSTSAAAWRSTRDEAGRVLAVLGPTNTGKTHFAVERMLAHRSGLMGFPLRLLAREIYDRIVALRGAKEVALLTGEEKIAPSSARYTICTVEAMPREVEVAFLAVDEIQLCADPERGHVFTERLLHARGLDETMFLGSEIVRPLLARLVPEAEVVTRPRFSTLSYAGVSKITRMPRRSAVVAFRAADVYKIAEVVRRQRGGAAVVLGALSPRTRNAQVQMYQDGEVDHLIATDAIGMGLNMDLHHVAFADLRKFDGRETRPLTVPEMAQIAGRAGRHTRDGTFGTTSQAGEMTPNQIEAIEGHSFSPLKQIYWRNADLDFSSVAALRESLEAPSPDPCLVKKRDAVDDLSFRMLTSHQEVRERATGRAAVSLLWRVCQVPDFTKMLADSHVALLHKIYVHLRDDGRLPTDWVADHVERLNRTDGDIDALTARLAHIRTWAYVSHREDWLDDPRDWQGRTRMVEDRLSDALHDHLTQRFVDRRTSALLKSMRERHDLPAHVTKEGAVVIDTHEVGHVEGLAFVVDDSADRDERRVLQAAARRVLGPEIAKRARDLLGDPDERFGVSGRAVTWRGHVVGHLRRSDEPLRPEIAVIDSPYLPGKAKEAVRDRLKAWLERTIARVLAPLTGAATNEGSATRGLMFLLRERLGNAATEEAQPLVKALTPAERRDLTRKGVRFGVHHVYLPALLKPAAQAWRRLLWGLHAGREPDLPDPGQVTIRRPEDDPLAPVDYAACGFAALPGFALRVDVLERVAARLRALARETPVFDLPLDLLALTGLSREAAGRLLRDLGYKQRPGESEEAPPRYTKSRRKTPRRKPQPGRALPQKRPPEDSPFAALAQLRIGSA